MVYATLDVKSDEKRCGTGTMSYGGEDGGKTRGKGKHGGSGGGGGVRLWKINSRESNLFRLSRHNVLLFLFYARKKGQHPS